MQYWQHPAAPEGVLIVALHINCHAYAGHGDTDSFNALTDAASVREIIDITIIRMKCRSGVVYALEKLLALPLALGQHGPSGRHREFHEIPIPPLL